MSVSYKGSPVEVVRKQSGWYTVILDGKTIKVRPSALTFEVGATLNSKVEAAAPAAPAAPEVINQGEPMSAQIELQPAPNAPVPGKAKSSAPKAPAKAKSSAPKAPAKAKSAKAPAKAKSAKIPAKSGKKAPAPKRAAASDVIIRVGPDGESQYSYQRTGKTASGNASYDCGDAAAVALRGKSLDEVYGIVAKAMMKAGDLKGDYANCTTIDGLERKLRAALKEANPGRQRMSLGNRLRAALK